MPGVDCGEIDEIAAHAEGARAGLDEAFGGFQRHAAGGDELEMREGCEQRLEIACASDGGAGKDLYVIGAGVPRGNGLSGRERTGTGDFVIGFGHPDYFWVKAGADDEFRAGIDGGLGLIGGGDGAGAEQELVAELFFEFLDEVDGVGNGHGDFNDGDAAGDHGVDHGAALGNALGTQNGNEADALDDLLGSFGHGFLSAGLAVSHPFRKERGKDGARDLLASQRAIRAEPPFMMRSTSESVAMLVSPGVVMARAPCATPHLTAQSMPLPASRP